MTYIDRRSVLGTLRRVLKLYEKHGWCRRDWDKRAGTRRAYCLAGAIYKVNKRTVSSFTMHVKNAYTFIELNRTIGKVVTFPNSMLCSHHLYSESNTWVWNDSVARDKRHVISVVKRTIKRLESEL